MRFFRQVVFKNFGLKVLALAISFFLWATYTAEPFAEVGYNVPIAFVNVPSSLAVRGDTPNTARVLLRGRAGLVRELALSDLSLTVDLTRAVPGDIQIHLDPAMVGVPYGTEVVRVSPAEFHLALVPSSVPVTQTE